MNTKYMQHKNVLVIEDETSLREIFCLVLELEGYHVRGVNNGQEALSYLLSLSGDEYPDAIMLDLMMPIMDGIEACRIIKDTPELTKIFILFLTARTEEFSEVAAFDAGADDFLSKPIKPKALLSRIQNILKRERFTIAR